MNNFKNLSKYKQSVYLSKLTVCILFVMLLAACTNDPAKIKNFNKPTTPDQVIKDAKMIRSEKGVVKVQMQAPLINNYEGENARTEYPKGVYVSFYNSDKSLKASLSAEYAIDKTNQREMEARKHIVIIDYRSHDTIYTEKITWNQKTKLIYSNDLVKCVGERTTSYGDGFEANETMDFIKIKNQRGTIKWTEEEPTE